MQNATHASQEVRLTFAKSAMFWESRSRDALAAAISSGVYLDPHKPIFGTRFMFANIICGGSKKAKLFLFQNFHVLNL